MNSCDFGDTVRRHYENQRDHTRRCCFRSGLVQCRPKSGRTPVCFQPGWGISFCACRAAFFRFFFKGKLVNGTSDTLLGPIWGVTLSVCTWRHGIIATISRRCREITLVYCFLCQERSGTFQRWTFTIYGNFKPADQFVVSQLTKMHRQ